MRRKYDFNDLKKFRYPNLVAEFMETGYSVCTLSDHMGLGRRGENDPLMKAKLFGEEEILTTEALALAGLFGCRMEYLFSNELRMAGPYPLAYVRHLESNRRQEKEFKTTRMKELICDTLDRLEESDEGFIERLYVILSRREERKHGKRPISRGMESGVHKNENHGA